MKTSEKLMSVLCDADGRACFSNDAENIIIDQAIEEVRLMEASLARIDKMVTNQLFNMTVSKEG